ncbi:conserved protein of unknown function [Sterolibacterium denitrificans]|uniref:DUF3619 domain-containing protein n=1 Tax=Sterolibacterium denitrificans TaxID=157592 RepID=A0A7Z7HRC2_9PROT|nr:DUF3619 family protein [Sterolibacterium denitrificans]SMB26297.1 conserved protein of unknown function [Sterolibacterium denitrificans]
MNIHPPEEQEFTNRIKRHLDHGADHLGNPILDRLMTARQLALAHQQTQVAGLGLAGLASVFNEILSPRARMLSALAALVIGMAGVHYWSGHPQADEGEDIDAALLSDDLPIHAYLDHGFQAWLEQP